MNRPAVQVISGSLFEVDLATEIVADIAEWRAQWEGRHIANAEQLLRAVAGVAEALLALGHVPPSTVQTLHQGHVSAVKLQDAALASPTVLWRSAVPDLIRTTGADAVAVQTFIEPLPGLGIVLVDSVALTEHHVMRTFARPTPSGLTERYGDWLRAAPDDEQSKHLYTDLTDVSRAFAEVAEGAGGAPARLRDSRYHRVIRV